METKLDITDRKWRPSQASLIRLVELLKLRGVPAPNLCSVLLTSSPHGIEDYICRDKLAVLQCVDEVQTLPQTNTKQSPSKRRAKGWHMVPTTKIEVRRCAVESFFGTSKKTQQRQEFHKLVVGGEILGDGSPIILEQFLPPGATAANTILPFKRGDKVEVHLIALSRVRGVYGGSFDTATIITQAVKAN